MTADQTPTVTTEALSEERLAELIELAWSPVYEPPAGTPDRVRHDALRDALREVQWLRGTARFNNSILQALGTILANHRVVARVDRPGQMPKLLTDLLEWASTAAARETHRLRALLDDDGRDHKAAAGLMRVPLPERTEAIRAHYDEFGFSGPTDLDRERDEVIGYLLSQVTTLTEQLAAATDRADKAEIVLFHSDLIHSGIRSRAEIEATLRAEQAQAAVARLDSRLRAANQRAEQAEARLAQTGKTSQFRVYQSPHGILIDWTDVVDGYTKFLADPTSAGKVRIEFRTVPASERAACRSCGTTERVLGNPPLCANCAVYAPRPFATGGYVDGPLAPANASGRCMSCDGTTVVCRQCHQPRHDEIADHFPQMAPCRTCNGGSYPSRPVHHAGLGDQVAATTSATRKATIMTLNGSITTRDINGVRILLLDIPELDVYTAPKLRAAGIQAVGAGHYRIVVDLADVDHIDSTGLGVLVGLNNRVKAHGGWLRLAAPNDAVRDMLSKTGLTKTFEVFDDAETARTATP